MVILAPVRAVSIRWLSALLLTAVGGCAGREFTGAFRSQPPPAFSSSGQVGVPDRWWITFDDPGLTQSVEQAFAGNFTLAAALQRLGAARALARREASDLFPDVDGVADIASLFGPGDDRTVFTWGLDASYQVDLWGQIESRVEAERLRAAATHADYHAIALTLSAEIARTWFSLIEARAQAALLEKQTETNRTGLQLQESRFGLGQTRSPDVLRQRQLVESTLEQEVIVQARIDVLEHQLAVLLGQMPQDASYQSGAALPDLPPLPDTGVPSELLHRRPDVRRDYLALQAADRDLASAISAQYPRISLTGSVLNVADHPETLFRDWFVSLGGQLIAPLIDGGQRRAEVDRQTSLVRESFNLYGQSMLNAFREVEDALALEKRQLERLKHLEKQVEFARQATDQLEEAYLLTPDEVEYLDVLSSNTSQQSLQRQLLSARLELLLIRVSLYLALAGDFAPRPLDLLDCPDWSGTTPPNVNAENGSLDLLELHQPEAPSPAEELPLPDVESETKELTEPEQALELRQLLRSVDGALLGIDVDE